MQRVRSFYRAKDGIVDYRFEFRKSWVGTWNAYILSQPSYRGRPEDAHSTHRLSDSFGSYVCWTRPLRSLEEARQVAAMWAEMTQRYIASGKRF